jgi:hypothetical protein
VRCTGSSHMWWQVYLHNVIHPRVACAHPCKPGVTRPESLARSHSPGVTRPESFARSHSPGVTRPESLARSHSPGVTRPESLARRHLPGDTRPESLAWSHSPGDTANAPNPAPQWRICVAEDTGLMVLYTGPLQDRPTLSHANEIMKIMIPPASRRRCATCGWWLWRAPAR